MIFSLTSRLTLLAIAASLAACGGSSNSTPTVTAAVAVPNTASATGLILSVFAQAPTATSKPDSIVQMGGNVYIAYQNAGEVEDGSVAGVSNAIVQYDLAGNALKTFTAPGHVDGLLARKDTNTLWALANEDGNPMLTIIDLTAGTKKSYPATVSPTAHGGGFDDMQLLTSSPPSA